MDPLEFFVRLKLVSAVFFVRENGLRLQILTCVVNLQPPCDLSVHVVIAASHLTKIIFLVYFHAIHSIFDI